MDVKILHFYPDLMSLYGSYANVSLLRRTLERMGNSVSVERVEIGGDADVSTADFVFMGAGTERSQKAALADFVRYGDAVKQAAEAGTAMLFAGTAMELLGRTVIDEHGRSYAGIGLADFVSTQSAKRIVGDVYGRSDLCDGAVVGFMNKSAVITGVETPLVTAMDMGYGNAGEKTAEGFCLHNVLASELTGPLLVKNPPLLRTVVEAIYARRGEELPALPAEPYAEAGYAITAEQLKKRAEA